MLRCLFVLIFSITCESKAGIVRVVQQKILKDCQRNLVLRKEVSQGPPGASRRYRHIPHFSFIYGVENDLAISQEILSLTDHMGQRIRALPQAFRSHSFLLQRIAESNGQEVLDDSGPVAPILGAHREQYSLFTPTSMLIAADARFDETEFTLGRSLGVLYEAWYPIDADLRGLIEDSTDENFYSVEGSELHVIEVLEGRFEQGNVRDFFEFKDVRIRILVNADRNGNLRTLSNLLAQYRATQDLRAASLGASNASVELRTRSNLIQDTYQGNVMSGNRREMKIVNEVDADMGAFHLVFRTLP
jgi:hypothetical protein